MRSIITLFLTIYFISVSLAATMNSEMPGDAMVPAGTCCPEFVLKDAVDICPPEGACKRNGPGLSLSFAACKNTPHTYAVYPNDPSFTYTWTVTGGTPASYTGNPCVVVWGSGSSGYIKVLISNISSGGTCLDSLAQEICLIDGPQANFTLSDDTVCVNTPVNLTNTSLGGSVYYWDFGDGTNSPSANPSPHSYSAPGTYTITLTATDMGSGHIVGGAQGETRVPCGCTDTISKAVVVLPGNGPVIDLDCCYGTVCPGDTSSFCTSMVCNSYSWSVTGGTIISGSGTNCIRVKWDATYTVPTTVTLQGCPSSPCSGSTTLNVPVLYPNLPISGPLTLCEGANGTFSLPSMPGTYYRWTVSGGLYAFNLVNRNSPTVNITFSTPGPFWVKCEYDNPLAGCNGLDSVLVNVLPVFFITGDEIVCEGDVKVYQANGPANWTIAPSGPTILSGNGTPAINVLWTPGSYTITATPLNPSAFCNANATKNVEVVAKPILGSIIGPDSICPGEKYTYSVSSNLGGSPYQWAITSGTGTILSPMGSDMDSVIVEFTGPGPWTLGVFQQIEISPGIFCASLPQSKAIDPYLTPNISGTQIVCVDDIATYTAGGSNPTGDFQWAVSPSNRGTIQSGQGTNSVTIKWHGPATTAILSVTTCSGTDTHPITINDPPVALASYSNLPVFCLNDGQVVTLMTPTGPGYSYQWYQNGSPVPGGTNASLVVTNNLATFPVPGTYQFYVLVTQNGCVARSNIINVIIQDCSGGGISPGPGCDILAQFSYYVVCNQISLIDQSIIIPPSTITNYQWSFTGPGTGTFAPNANVPNPVLTVSAAGTYTISLVVTSSSGCIDSTGQTVSVILPVASFTYTNPVCENVPATFNAIPNNPNYSYLWNFGDGSTSYDPITQHAYVVAGTYIDTLTITDEYGCVATAIDTITVNPTPVCTITASDTVFCPGSTVTLTACGGMSSYQWYRNGNQISGANAVTYSANQPGKYWVEVTNSFGCTDKSNKLFIYMLAPPTAKVTGTSYVCASAGNPVSFFINAYYDANYAYSWSSNPAGASFSPPNGSSPFVTITLPGTLPATYQVILDVTDVTTSCVASDTLCITFYQTPQLSIPALNICEGTPVTLTPTPNDTVIYSYQWNTGANTPVITASLPGFYSLTITDKSNGCSATAFAGSIFSRPDLSLFPRGCDTICQKDTMHLYIPLPLNALFPNNTYPNAYPGITWYDNGNYGSPIGTGKDLFYAPGVTGSHQISVIVSNSSGCVDTAGVFCLQVKECPPLSEMDLGDAPENPDLGQLYPTTLVNNGARHFIVSNIFMGTLIDVEADGQPTSTSDGDDLNNVDDEDGVVIPSVVGINSTVNITVTASVNGFLDAWMDFNVNGTWSDPGEHIFVSQALTAGSNNLSFNVPATATMGQSYTRFRFRTFNTPITYNGLVTDGEVEDYAVFIEEFPPQGELDWGDAPDNAEPIFSYNTLLSTNGARHIIQPGVYMGSFVDVETDGQPSMLANGDDNDIFFPSAGDDEDGVQFVGVMYVGKPVNLNVTASTSGFMNVWMDYNKNGDWVAPVEHIFINQPVNAGINPLNFTIPVAAQKGYTYLRFRFNTTGGLTYSGLASDGEVEDYRVHVCPYWNPIPTDVTHTIHMPVTLSGFEAGDAIGVFYDDGTGNLSSAGLVEWDGVDSKVMTAYGDDPATPDVTEGFAIGQPIIWVLCSKRKGTAIPIEVIYDPAYPDQDGTFVDGGLSGLTEAIIICDLPTALNATEITTESATLGWTPGSTEEQWDILYGHAGFDPATDGTLITGLIVNSYILSGLEPQTAYEFYVRAVCGDEAMSAWAGSEPFTTFSESLPGDANCDGTVNVLDIVTIVNAILGQDPDPFCFMNADVNTDGSINVLDIVAVINIILQG